MYGFFLVKILLDFSCFIVEGEMICFGNIELKFLFIFGYLLVSLLFYCEKDWYIIVGDVFFFGSIGCIDFFGGNFNMLIKSIKEEYYLLGDDVVVYLGYGLDISVGYEWKMNLFLNS